MEKNNKKNISSNVKNVTINGTVLRKMLLSAAKLLDSNKDYVDQLNVFPVPDGDTGTNMSLTMMSAAKEVTACDSNNIDELCSAMSKGALRGARGNSGVILSQILKGIGDVLLGCEKFISPKTLAKAFSNGSDVAYKAVTKPKEGTMLTVIRGIAEGAKVSIKKFITMEDFLKNAIDVGEAVLKTTPDLLPVLKKAGVVDAGGRGLIIILQGFYNVILGKEDTTMEFNDTIDRTNNMGQQFHVNYMDLADIEFAYCTEFFIINLHKKTTLADIDRFRESLCEIGDCVLVIGDLSLVKIHVHTNDPGKALTYAVELGEVDKIKIENMLEQNRALLSKMPEELKQCGMLAICAGEGLANIFKDLLVDSVIEGGQTMNPSAEDIAKACDKVLAKDVFVFPNNPNIILAAEQAKHLSKRNILVIPTKSIPEGLSAVLSFNPEDTVENNIANMDSNTSNVKSGSVTFAVRNTNMDNMDLKEGDIIGLSEKTIISKGDGIDEVTTKLVEGMVDENSSNITLYFGKDITLEQAERLSSKIAKKYSKCDVDVHEGGQPLYYYIVSVE